MKRLSALDKAIILIWIIILFLACGLAGLAVFDALTDPSYFQYRSIRHILGCSVATIALGVLGYLLCCGLWKDEPDMELLKSATILLGNLPLICCAVLVGMILLQKEEDAEGIYEFIAGSVLIFLFGLFTRRRFRERMEIKKDPAIE